MAPRRWTIQEEESVIYGSITESVPETMTRLGRSYDSIERKRNALRKQGRMKDRDGMSWTAEDDDLLRAMFAAGLKDRQIAARLLRTMRAVKQRRVVLGVKKVRSDSLVVAPSKFPEFTALPDGVLMRTIGVSA